MMAFVGAGGGTAVGWDVIGPQPVTTSALRMSINPRVYSLLFISGLLFLFLDLLKVAA
jgi:hypothetical protein